MSRWTSSLRLRRDLLAVCACLAAFACPAAAWAAGGTPMPAPDDPPGGFATSSSTATKSSKSTQSSKPARAVPTPDAPVVRLVRGSGRDKATGHRQDRGGDPVARGLAAVEPGSDAAPGLHVDDPVAYHAGRAEAEREAAAGPGSEGEAEADARRDKARDRLPRDHAARRCAVRPSGCRARSPRRRRCPAGRVARRSGAPTCRRGGRDHRLGVAARSATRQA